MRVDNKKISKLITEYYSLLQITEDKKEPDFKEKYNQRLSLASTLRDIVLTGSELVETGILEQILEKDVRLARAYKKSLNALKKEYKKLKKDHEELEEKYEESPMDYERLIEGIRLIISGKTGSIIDEINSVLDQE